MTVYLDVLIALNILFTYIFLVSVRAFISLPTNKYLIAVGSFLGGIASLVVFLGDMGVAFSVFYKIITGAIIVYVSFIPKSVRLFLKEYFSFFGVSFLFGGIMFALELTKKNEKIFYMNGTVYFDITLQYLIVAVLLIYIVFLLVNYFYTQSLMKNEILKVTVSYKDIEISLNGFVDTGNNLKDCFTGKPIYVAEMKAFAPFFNYEELNYLKSNFLGDMPKSLTGKVRLVPTKTVGGSGLLPAFSPDKITFKNKKSAAEAKNALIALTSEKIGEGDYQIILNKNILDLSWSEDKDDRTKKKAKST